MTGFESQKKESCSLLGYDLYTSQLPPKTPSSSEPVKDKSLKLMLSKLQNELKSDAEPTNSANIKVLRELTQLEQASDQQKAKLSLKRNQCAKKYLLQQIVDMEMQ